MTTFSCAGRLVTARTSCRHVSRCDVVRNASVTRFTQYLTPLTFERTSQASLVAVLPRRLLNSKWSWNVNEVSEDEDEGSDERAAGDRSDENESVASRGLSCTSRP